MPIEKLSPEQQEAAQQRASLEAARQTYRAAIENVYSTRASVTHARSVASRYRIGRRVLTLCVTLCGLMVMLATTLASISGWVPNLGAAIVGLYVTGGSALLPLSIMTMVWHNQHLTETTTTFGNKKKFEYSTPDSELRVAEQQHNRAVMDLNILEPPEGMQLPIGLM